MSAWATRGRVVIVGPAFLVQVDVAVARKAARPLAERVRGRTTATHAVRGCSSLDRGERRAARVRRPVSQLGLKDGDAGLGGCGISLESQ